MRLVAVLTKTEKDIIMLILRSNDQGDGWRKVSNILWDTVTREAPKALVDIDYIGQRIRLNADGLVVVRYL